MKRKVFIKMIIAQGESMKEAYTIYVEDDEELVNIEGYFTVKKKDSDIERSTYTYIGESEIKKSEGFRVTSCDSNWLLVKNGEC